MKKVNWKWDYCVYFPFFPYCDEPAYEKDHCCFCNKPYEWVDGKYKNTVVEVGKHTIIQATNNHISIYENGELISHISCTKKFNETELKELLAEEVNFMQKLFKGEVEE